MNPKDIGKNGLPRLARRMTLPPELTNRGSRLGVSIRIASDAVDSNLPHAQELIKDVQTLARTICPHYKPDMGDQGQMMCDSGHDGRPYLGRRCCTSDCQLSQVKLSGPGFFYSGGDALDENKEELPLAAP